jgi:predicted ATPase
LNNQRTNLPTQLTSFVGRENELAEIDKLIDNPECRLLTLVGPGGIGKTRLALQTAAQHVQEYPDGTYFVPLAPLSSADFLVPTVAEALRFEFYTQISNLDPKSQLLDYLAEQSVFLVMDNFEHVLEGADLIPELLTRAPNLQLIITSRERLNLQGEWTYDVGGMSYPENGDGVGGNDHSAINLFYDRARQVDPGFTMDKEVRGDISQICKLVDGMPLGIELAAAWVSVLSPEEIADEIGKNLEFLASSRRDLEEKHRSMHAAFDYSWKLISEDEREAFKSLSVFRGGFQRDAAEKVADVHLRMLSDLVNKSLLRRTEKGRYEVHELLRQYASEKLEQKPQEFEECREQHSKFYVEFLEVRKDELMGENLLEVREEMRGEMGNLRSAIKWAVTQWEADRARQALRIYYGFLIVHGWHEAREEIKYLLGHVEQNRVRVEYPDFKNDPVYLSAITYESRFHILLSSFDQAEKIVQEYLPAVRELGESIELESLLFSLACITSFKGQFQNAIPLFEEALALGRKYKDEIMVAVCLIYSGWNLHELGEYTRAQDDFQECYNIFEDRGSQWGLAFALSKLGLVADGLRDYKLSLKHHSESREILAKFGDKAGMAYATSRMSVGKYGLNDFEEAIQLGQEGYELFKELGHRWGMTVSLCRVGFAELQLSEVGAARNNFFEALKGALEIEYIPLSLYAISGIASVMVEKGQHIRAAELFEFFDKNPRTPALYKDIVEPWSESLKGHLLVQELEEARARGIAFEFEDLVMELLKEEKAFSMD